MNNKAIGILSILFLTSGILTVACALEGSISILDVLGIVAIYLSILVTVAIIQLDLWVGREEMKNPALKDGVSKQAQTSR